MGLRRPALLLAGLLLLLVPQGASLMQDRSVSVSLEAFPEPVVPRGGEGRARVEASVACGVLGSASRLTLALEDVPAWAEMRVEPASFTPRSSECSSGRYVARAEVVATTTDDALAYRAANYVVRAEHAGSGGLERGEARGALQAGYRGVTEVEPQRTRLSGGLLDQLVYPVKVANKGNGLTRVNFEVVDPPPGWTVVPPASVVVDTPLSGGESIVFVNVAVQTPASLGSAPREVAILIRTFASYVHAAASGDSHEFTLHATASGGGTPAPAGAAVVAVVAAAAWWLARRPRS